jgi:hypothetical protein
MNPSNPSHSTVKHTKLQQHKAAASLATVNNIINAGTQSAAVQNSPVAKQALAVLQAAAASAQSALTNKIAVVQEHQTATKTQKLTFASVGDALRSYEAAVNVLADGDGAVINQAGLQTRAEKPPRAALGTVDVLRGKPGKLPTEAVISWPEVAGATSYAIEVNWTPATPTGPWTAIGSGSSRRRLVTAPSAGAQFLVRIAAIASNGTQSIWSNPILVTAH